MKQEGFRGLWKGFTISTVGYVPTQIAYYWGYEGTKHVLKKSVKYLESLSPSLALSQNHTEVIVAFGAGAMAEAISGFVWVPVDAVSQRLQIQGPQKTTHLYKGGLDGFAKIVQAEGVPGLYRGYTASMYSYIPSSAISWGVYEWMKQQLAKLKVHTFPHWAYYHCQRISGNQCVRPKAENLDPEDSHLLHFLAGLIAGSAGIAVVNPMDVVKTRLQTDTFLQDYLKKQSKAYHGPWSAIAKVAREEGVSALSKGLMTRLIFSAPLVGLHYTVYELCKYLSMK